MGAGVPPFRLAGGAHRAGLSQLPGDCAQSGRAVRHSRHCKKMTGYGPTREYNGLETSVRPYTTNCVDNPSPNTIGLEILTRIRILIPHARLPGSSFSVHSSGCRAVI